MTLGAGAQKALGDGFAPLGDPQNLLMAKDSAAGILRDEIVSGKLRPGEAIIEGKTAKRLGVAQTTIREAINTLVAEGFLEKASGRSARVTLLGEEEVSQTYQFRAVLEGFAARLVAEKKEDVADLTQLIADMRAAVDCNNIRAFYERDLRFHLLICRKSGNRCLEQALQRLIVPLFAFVVIRVHGRDEKPEWTRSIEQHQQMMQAIRSGDPYFAEQHVRNTILKFFAETRQLVTEQGAVPGPSMGDKE